MHKEKRKRTGTRRTTMAVLEILKTSTNMGNPISIAQLVKQLKQRYEIETSWDSVKAILEDLIKYYPGPDKIQCKQCENRRAYQKDYYYQTELPEALQENIQKIEQVIQNNKTHRVTEQVLSFQFNGYGSDKQLHSTGNPIEYVYPVRILWAYEHPYLVGFFTGRQDVAHFRIDLMRFIRAIEIPKQKDIQRNFRINQIEAKDYKQQHLYMFYERPDERPKRIRLKVKKIPQKPNASLTFLQDTFGTHWQSISNTETDQALEVWVRCLPSAIAQFVQQYIDRVVVLEPKEVVEEVETTLKQNFEAYFKEKFL